MLKRYLPKFLIKKRKKLTDKDLKLSLQLYDILGSEVTNLHLYREAFSLKHSLKYKIKNYERLEFLGDSVLGSIISYYFFTQHPKASEGSLTQLKSKIVSRKNLNKIGENLGLVQLVEHQKNGHLGENINGNLLEALIGAVFLDKGYEATQDIVLNRLIRPEEIAKLENKIVSYKGLLLEWSQKKKTSIQYKTSEESLPNKSIVFRCYVLLNQEKIANASETSKKKAEEKAAQRAFYFLNKKEKIFDSQKPI